MLFYLFLPLVAMDDPLNEMRLDEMSRQTASACRQSRLDKNLTERSRSASGSTLRHSKSFSDNSEDRSRDRSKSKHNPHRSRSNDRPGANSRGSEGETSVKNADLGVRVENSSPSSLATTAAGATADITRNLESLSLNSNEPDSRPPPPPQPDLGAVQVLPPSTSEASRPHAPSLSQIGNTPSLQQSMKQFLPSSSDSEAENLDDRGRDETIFENQVWPRDDNASPNSVGSHNSSEILFGLRQTEEDLRHAVLEADRLRALLSEERRLRQRDIDERESMLMDREREIESLLRKLEASEGERDTNKKATDLLASKMQTISDLKRQIENLNLDLAKADENVVASRKLHAIEKAARKEEVSSLKDELEVLVQANKDKDRKYESVKQKLSKIKRETSSVVGSMRRTASTLSLRPSETDQGPVMPIGDDDSIAETDSPTVTRPTLSKNDMCKRLAATKWPRRKVFFSNDDFVDALKSLCDSLFSLGIDKDEIAFSLNTDLMASDIASAYAAHKKQMKTITLDGVLEAVSACDKASKILSDNEKFSLITLEKGEDYYSVMRRLETAYSDYNIGDPTDVKAMLRVLKKRFCEAVSLPHSVRQAIRHCQDLDDVVACANEDMAKLQADIQLYQAQTRANDFHEPALQNFGQNRGFNQQKGHKFRGNNQQRNNSYQWQQQPQQQQASLPQQQQQLSHQQQVLPQQHRMVPQQQQLMPHQHQFMQQQPRPLMQLQLQRFPQQQLQQSHQGEINAVTQQRVFASPDASVPRAPTGFEHARENRDILMCTRCRVMSHHSRQSCPNHKFCSMCRSEGHSDYEHNIVVQGMNNRSASGPQPHQQQLRQSQQQRQQHQIPQQHSAQLPQQQAAQLPQQQAPQLPQQLSASLPQQQPPQQQQPQQVLPQSAGR